MVSEQKLRQRQADADALARNWPPMYGGQGDPPGISAGEAFVESDSYANWVSRFPDGAPPVAMTTNTRVTEPDPSVEASHPGERFPKGDQGRFLSVRAEPLPRYRPAARSAEAIETSIAHVGFRCVVRTSRT